MAQLTSFSSPSCLSLPSAGLLGVTIPEAVKSGRRSWLQSQGPRRRANSVTLENFTTACVPRIYHSRWELSPAPVRGAHTPICVVWMPLRMKLFFLEFSGPQGFGE